MPTINLPPETPQEALRIDRHRPAVVCLAPRSELPERSHGGEPDDVRVFRIASSSVTLISAFNQPWRDSASSVIIEGIHLERSPSVRIAPADYRRS